MNILTSVLNKKQFYQLVKRTTFFNRLDGVVQFKPLNKKSLCQITEKEFLSISKREGLSKEDIKLVWTEEVTEFFAEKSFDPRYGASSLQRTIETLLISPLANFFLWKTQS